MGDAAPSIAPCPRRTAKNIPRQPGAPYTKAEAAAFLRMSQSQIEALMHRKLLRKLPGMRTVLFSAKTIETFGD